MPRTYTFPAMSLEKAQATKAGLEWADDGVVVTITPSGAGAFVLVATYPDGPNGPALPGGDVPGPAPSTPVASPPVLPALSATLPSNDPVPKAPAPADLPPYYWPLVTLDTHWNEINYTDRLTNKPIGSRPGRAFHANRPNGGRHHAAIDLSCSANDLVIAIAAGRIVDFYGFYKAANGEYTFALIVAHENFVANYGEVDKDSLFRLGLKKGDKVAAGQTIAWVGATKMLHFETYVPGSTRNARWLVGQPRPPSLLDPTDMLLWLAASGMRLEPDPTAPTIPAPALPNITSYSGPRPDVGTWTNFGRKYWAWDRDGLKTHDNSGSVTLHKGDADQKTCRRIWDLYANIILAAAKKHDVSPALIIMTIATESAAQMKDQFTGPDTFRWEANVWNKDVDPPFQGTYSAGPMQCLATTVRDIIKRNGTTYELAYQRFEVAPAIAKKPASDPTDLSLYDPATSIDIGTAEIRDKKSSTHYDPIRVAAAYNAGGLYPSSENEWGLKTYDNHLDRAAGWYSDACVVLAEQGLN